MVYPTFFILLQFVPTLVFVLSSYCDCLAAGVYCTDSCACSNCLNKSENEGVVQIIREKIESRDPLAFAPRVVNPDTDTSVASPFL